MINEVNMLGRRNWENICHVQRSQYVTKRLSYNFLETKCSLPNWTIKYYSPFVLTDHLVNTVSSRRPENEWTKYKMKFGQIANVLYLVGLLFVIQIKKFNRYIFAENLTTNDFDVKMTCYKEAGQVIMDDWKDTR